MCARFISMTILGLHVDSVAFQAKISTADKGDMGSPGMCGYHDNACSHRLTREGMVSITMVVVGEYQRRMWFP